MARKKSKPREPGQPSTPTLANVMPAALSGLLSQTGSDFIERSGVEFVRQATLQVLLGQNIRTQTEPLTRQRISEVAGCLLALFTSAHSNIPDFTHEASRLAIQHLAAKGAPGKPVGQWLVGLTKKSVQNVLRGDTQNIEKHVVSFENAIQQAAKTLEGEFGKLEFIVNIPSVSGKQSRLSWIDTLRLTTTIGCAELAVRGADKSRYGKLFERLVLGSVLSILGFDYDADDDGSRRERVFVLSSARGDRECDATLIVKPGVVGQFDIGFIGVGNSEITKDKLSRYARSGERGDHRFSSTSFVIVDRLPTGPKAKSHSQAKTTGTEIIQMSMTLWPRDLAKSIANRLDYTHPLAQATDEQASKTITQAMQRINPLDFLRGR